MEGDLFHSRRIHMIPIERIVPNPRQPRRLFDPTALQELAVSIQQHGILQPLSVQKEGNAYTLVAGERRLRAAEMAGLHHVPCLLVRLTPEDSAVLALVENIQRCDLHYLEEAAAIARLLSRHGLSQDEVARRLGRSQSAVANKLRLLRLSPACVELLHTYQLTERHARAVLRLEEDVQRQEALRTIGQRGLTVAQAESYIEGLLTQKQRHRPVWILKDVRLFLNSVNRGMETIRQAGVDAVMERQDSEEDITLTIRIPKRRAVP